MDELTTAGSNHVCGFGSLNQLKAVYTAADLNLTRASHEDIMGGSADENRAILNDIIHGKGNPGLIDTLLLNAEAAFFILDKVESIDEGYPIARDILLGGRLQSWLEQVKAFYETTSPGK